LKVALSHPFFHLPWHSPSLPILSKHLQFFTWQLHSSGISPLNMLQSVDILLKTRTEQNTTECV
jgi:hypothetical protein